MIELAPGAVEAPHARRTTVLLAELRAPEMDSADAAAPRYVKALREAAELSGGRVLHDRNNAVLALFPSADAAAAAAARMHTYAETLPSAPDRPGLGIAFHAGPVAQRDEDIFGDTVNLTLHLAAEAKSGQILTSHDTASTLSPAIQDAVRPASAIRIAGRGEEVVLGELQWRNAMRSIVAAHAKAASTPATLRLTWQGRTVLRRREGDSILLGRGNECGLQVEGAAVSRQHCTIFQRDGRFFLRDHSRNGTYVVPSGQADACVREAEVALAKAGDISLGQPPARALHLISFNCT